MRLLDMSSELAAVSRRSRRFTPTAPLNLASPTAQLSAARRRAARSRRRSKRSFREHPASLAKSLPDDVIFHVFCFLGMGDLRTCRLVSHLLYDTAECAMQHVFTSAFGASPAGLSRRVFFRMLHRLDNPSQKTRIELFLNASARGYDHFIRTHASSIPSGALNVLNVGGLCGLHLAAMHGRHSTVSLLLALGVDTSRVSKSGKQAIHFAAERDHHDVLDVLIGLGELDVNTLDADKHTPLYHACKAGNLGIAAKLLEAGAWVDGRPPPIPEDETPAEHGDTPLFAAAENGHHPCVRLLLQHHADPNLPTSTGKTPLYTAAENGNTTIVRVLLRHGTVDTSVLTSRGRTPLYAAAEQGHVDVVARLLAHCTLDTVFQRTVYGTTAVYAASKQHQDVLKLLMAYFLLVRRSDGPPSEREILSYVLPTCIVKRNIPPPMFDTDLAAFYAAVKRGQREEGQDTDERRWIPARSPTPAVQRTLSPVARSSRKVRLEARLQRSRTMPRSKPNRRRSRRASRHAASSDSVRLPVIAPRRQTAPHSRSQPDSVAIPGAVRSAMSQMTPSVSEYLQNLWSGFS